jgi:hypothetical protein
MSRTVSVSDPSDEMTELNRALQEVVELGNRLLEEDPEADSWDVASGLLAGAVHFWLYSRQPCGDPLCESCTDIDTAEKRLRMLLDETRQSAEESEYFHTPSDANVGRA